MLSIPREQNLRYTKPQKEYPNYRKLKPFYQQCKMFYNTCLKCFFFSMDGNHPLSTGSYSVVNKDVNLEMGSYTQ